MSGAVIRSGTFKEHRFDRDKVSDKKRFKTSS